MMRKSIINRDSNQGFSGDRPWLDLEGIARVEITSEEPGYPIESALMPGEGPGWRASEAGEQTLRLVFDQPQHLRRIRVVFVEDRRVHTHEFLLRWSEDGGRSCHQIVRQQYTFSPPDTTREVEEYSVNLKGVRVLELKIIPDISGGDDRASLTSLQLA